VATLDDRWVALLGWQAACLSNVKYGRQREDLSQVRIENDPHMMATLRELIMRIMRLAGVKNIAKAVRNFAASVHETLRQLGL
jgi:hypothetical protein